jgi:DNA-binding transcriptional LysR family regulator
MLLDPELLTAFVAVADHRSFTRAAAALNRTQSAISMQIKRLEERAGAELFHRSSARVTLSPSGEALLGYARRILSLSEEAAGRLREHKIDGVVRLGVMDDYGTFLVPGILAAFANSYPHIQMEMETGLTGTMLERLGASFDLVIAMHPEGSRKGELLRREQAVWAAGALHQAETSDPLQLALYPAGCLFREWAIEALDRAARPWRISFVSHSLAAVESIAAEGLAVTVVKSGTFPARLRRLTANHNMPPLPAADICLHRAPRISRAASLLGDHLAASLRALPPVRDQARASARRREAALAVR